MGGFDKQHEILSRLTAGCIHLDCLGSGLEMSLGNLLWATAHFISRLSSVIRLRRCR